MKKFFSRLSLRWAKALQELVSPERILSRTHLGYDMTWDVHGHCHLWDERGGEVEMPKLQALLERMQREYGDSVIPKKVVRKGDACNDYQ
jgi:hypothetical protein